MVFSIASSPIEPAALARDMADDRAGAFASFEGRVRDNNDGHKVTRLEYEIFAALALSEGRAIIAEATEKFSLVGARAVHRDGTLAIGECAVWVGVTAKHRAAAFDACRYIIDEVKHRLPVWKKEFYEGLEPQWVNCQHIHASPSSLPAPENPSPEDFYSRQVKLPEIGASGQARLRAAKILIVGAGGLGSSAALALAAAGVGTIGIAEHDILEASNLHRQTLYAAGDIGLAKAGLAVARLKNLNPLIEVRAHPARLDAGNVETILDLYDLVLDCTDNFKTKYLLNDAAILKRIPLIQASVYRFEGQLLTIEASSPEGCLRCLWPQAPDAGLVGDCAETGVLGTVPALFGTLQANEALKRILGLPANKNLLLMDLLDLSLQTIERKRDPACAVCGEDRISLHDPVDYLLKEGDTVHSLKRNFYLIDVREEDEIARQLVEGAFHLPASAFNDAAIEANKDAPLLLICAAGVRSRAAADYLRGRGWSQAYSLEGGLAGLLSRTGRAA